MPAALSPYSKVEALRCIPYLRTERYEWSNEIDCCSRMFSCARHFFIAKKKYQSGGLTVPAVQIGKLMIACGDSTPAADKLSHLQVSHTGTGRGRKHVKGIRQAFLAQGVFDRVDARICSDKKSSEEPGIAEHDRHLPVSDHSRKRSPPTFCS